MGSTSTFLKFLERSRRTAPSRTLLPEPTQFDELGDKVAVPATEWPPPRTVRATLCSAQQRSTAAMSVAPLQRLDSGERADAASVRPPAPWLYDDAGETVDGAVPDFARLVVALIGGQYEAI